MELSTDRQVSNLVFYTLSTGVVISEQQQRDKHDSLISKSSPAKTNKTLCNFFFFLNLIN